MSRLYEKLQQEKETILTTANRHRATNVRLFGSVVRGEEHDASDIDFLVDFLPGSTLLDIRLPGSAMFSLTNIWASIRYCSGAPLRSIWQV